MLRYALLAILVTNLFASPSTAQDTFRSTSWTADDEGDVQRYNAVLTLGGGLGFSPDYEGSDGEDLQLLPYAELSLFDGLASLSLEGLEVWLPLSNQVFVGAGIGYDSGRNENVNDTLEGLGDVDGTVVGSLAVGFEIDAATLGVTFTHDLGSGHEGYIVDLEAGYQIEVIKNTAELSLGANVIWASDKYTEAFFGVSADQSAASGLAASEVDAGFKSAGVEIDATYLLGQQKTLGLELNYIAGLTFGYQRLLGDAAKSVIVRDEGSPDQLSAAAVITVSFGLF